MDKLAQVLPAVNACLNGLSATLAFLGFLAIRRKNVWLHWRLMVAAASTHRSRAPSRITLPRH